MNDGFIKDDIEKKTQILKRRKWYFSAFMIAAMIVVFCTVYALILPAITLSASKTAALRQNKTVPALSYSMYNNTETEKTLRAYLEYALPGMLVSETQGVLRQSVFYVYAYAGETICLGSDVTQSLIDINEQSQVNQNGVVNAGATPTGVDIVVTGPNGTKYTFDNDAETGLGYIGTGDQEKAGANFEGSNNINGYKPHELTARETGIYEVRFHSYSGNAATVATGVEHLKDSINCGGSEIYNPAPRAVNYNNQSFDDWYNTGCSIGAFDITVVSEGVVKTGRTYSKLLALNMGKNATNKGSATLYGDFYIVTDDGYIYRNKFNLDPWGFIFFVNSRGIVDNKTGSSAYYSIRGTGQDFQGWINMEGLNYSFYNPNNEDSLLDKTYMIFFEEPDAELEGTLYKRAFAPSKVDKIDFIGSKEGNITYVGNGGYFEFEIQNAVSVTITIDFSNYNRDHPEDNLTNVSINANVKSGTNRVYWDGYDGLRKLVPTGWYENGLIDIKLEAHAGEFHFPFLDVECSAGVSYERVNEIYEYVDGRMENVTNRYESSKYTVYYDNTHHLNELYEGENNSPGGLTIGDNLDMSGGNNSSSFKMIFATGENGIGLGDYSVLDVWTYASASTDVSIQTDIVVEDIEGYYTTSLEGLVFFDKDDNSQYELIGGDFPLSDVNVSLDYYYCGTRWSIERDENNNITALLPTYKSKPNNSGENTQEEILYYYHDYEVRLQDDGMYHVYSYAYNDTLHENAPTEVLDKYEHPVTVDICTYETIDDVTQNTTTVYGVWIPVHRETTTSVLGKYAFAGVLVNENWYDPPAGLNTDLVVTVTNPEPDLYAVTTSNAVTGDFGTCGSEEQRVPLTTLESKIQDDINALIENLGDDYDREANRNFRYEMADVGYYYPTYEPPLIVAKNWGSEDDFKDIQKVTLGIEGFITQSAGNTVPYYFREITLDYHSWNETLTDLPANVIVEGNNVPLSYRVIYETFTKSSSGITYVYKYDWSVDPPSGNYYSYVYDSNNNVVYDIDENDESVPRLQLLGRADYPYETFVYELKKLNTGDYISVENWASDTCSIKITKKGADDDVSLLENATFQLQRYSDETSDFVDVKTAQGKYTITTDKNGVAVFHGLTEGTYRLVEVVPPDFYSAVDPIPFVVSKDPETGTNNADVVGSYYDDYSTVIYDHLLEHPVSVMKKVDQYGDSVANARFAFYKANDDYSYTENDLIYLDEERQIPAIFTFDSNGTAVLEKSVGEGKTRYLYISELHSLLNGSDKFVLKEIDTPKGYRSVGEAHMRITGEKLSSYIICDNPYESGVWVEPIVTVYAPETLQVVDMSQLSNISSASYVDSETGEIDYVQYTNNGNITSKGTLFAVVVKRNGAESDNGNLETLTFEDWAPVYGNPIDGYHTLSDISNTTSLERVCELIRNHKDNVYEFTANSNGTLMYTRVENLPGKIERYFTYMDYNNISPEQINGIYSDPQYAVLYYYSTAESLEDVDYRNTARVTSHGLYRNSEKFTTHFAADILIPDISNNLYIQKTDEENTLIDNAAFGMYHAVAEQNGVGYYTAENQNKETVYVALSEDGEMTAEVYSGTVDANGVLITKNLITDGDYSVNTERFNEISSLTEEEVHNSSGYVSRLSGFGSAGVITVTGNNGNTYTITPAKNGEDISLVCFTHKNCKIVSDESTAHFQLLTKGKYYVRELYAPQGFELNYTNIEVVVGDEEVYANAGETDDGVMVGNGAGYVISTLNQFASKGDIRETLTYIKAALRLDNNSTKNGFTANLSSHMTWPYVSLNNDDALKYIFDGTEATTTSLDQASLLYLMYNGNSNYIKNNQNTIFDYCVNPSGSGQTINSLLYWTRSGWSDLAIFQDATSAHESDLTNPEVTYTDISLKDGQPNDISRLFSSSTFIRVTDKTKIGLKIQKVDSATGTELENARFVLYKIDADNAEKYYFSLSRKGNAVWSTLSGNKTEEDFIFATNSLGEYQINQLDTGVYYLKEIYPPSGYSLLPYEIIITVAGSNITAVNSNSGQSITVVEPQEINENNDIWLYTVVVPNDLSYMLPATGGSGTLMYTLGGLTLMAAASVVYGYVCFKRRKRVTG